jgi:hypothetical protein
MYITLKTNALRTFVEQFRQLFDNSKPAPADERYSLAPATAGR